MTKEVCPVCKGKGHITEEDLPKCANPTCKRKGNLDKMIVFCDPCHEAMLKVQAETQKICKKMGL